MLSAWESRPIMVGFVGFSISQLSPTFNWPIIAGVSRIGVDLTGF